jgi:fermentation-respiration switch protein FrsA (DUF1100 family)
MNRKRIIYRSLALLTALLILIVASGTYFFKLAIVRTNDNDATATPLNWEWLDGQRFETLHISSDDGLRLTGYFLQNDSIDGKLAVIVHGHRQSADAMSSYAQMFYDDGYSIFLADDRAHGASDGRYIGFGWLDRFDYLHWLEYLIGRMGSDIRIVLHGVSMGAATVMMMSGEPSLPPQVKAVVEDCGFTSVREEFNFQIRTHYHLPPFPIINVANIESRLFAGYNFDEASATAQVAKSHTPTLFIHGDADRYVPTEMVYKLFDAASCEKQLLIVANAKHGNAIDTDKKTYSETVREFCSRYISH